MALLIHTCWDHGRQRSPIVVGISSPPSAFKLKLFSEMPVLHLVKIQISICVHEYTFDSVERPSKECYLDGLSGECGIGGYNCPFRLPMRLKTGSESPK